jgi:hypothetical protein
MILISNLFFILYTEPIEIITSDVTIVNRYQALENSSLNDVVVDKKGDVIVSVIPLVPHNKVVTLRMNAN